MATPTAPTVVLPAPEPAPAAPSGPLAAILDPVQPARPVQAIGSTAKLAEESTGAPAEKAAKASARGGQQDGPFGALVRAIAARIGRPGSATTTKRTHTITEQRATGNQQLNRSTRDAKHQHAAQHQNTRDAKMADLRNKTDQQQGRTNRDARSTSNRGATQAGTTKDDRTSKTGRDVKDHRGAQTSDTTAAKKDDATKTGTDVRDAKTTGGSATQKPVTAKDTTAPKDPAGKPATADAKPDGQRPGDKVNLDKAPPATAPRARTQSSREAGYRDGTRAGAVVGHAKAWKDGVEDGYFDRKAADDAERRRMDRAKADNARRPKATAPDMKPASSSTVDLEKKMPTTQTPAAAQPVTVTGISASSVSFGDPGGAMITMSRGEVRTLKAFEQRMAAKVPVMLRVAEECKETRKTAEDLALRAQRLAEQAKHVDGGARLVAKLNRLAEQAAILKTKTSDMEKAAVRGEEAVRVVVANAHTRHGGIYRAVVESPLTKPAERDFYTDRQGS